MEGRLSMFKNVASLFIIAFLCVQIPVCNNFQQQNSIESTFTISDDLGPSFLIPIQHTFLDCAWPEGIHEFSVDTYVTVTDSDGVAGMGIFS